VGKVSLLGLQFFKRGTRLLVLGLHLLVLGVEILLVLFELSELVVQELVLLVLLSCEGLQFLSFLRELFGLQSDPP
jgi:hypothetical protein